MLMDTLKVFLSKKNGEDTVTIDHDEFRHIIIFQGGKPAHLSIFYKGVYSSIKLSAGESVVDLCEQEDFLKKNRDFF